MSLFYYPAWHHRTGAFEVTHSAEKLQSKCMCAVKVIVFPWTNPYSIPSLKLRPSFLSFLHFLTASQVSQNPVQHSLRHCHVLGAQSFKCRIIPWIYGWGSDNRDLASWVVTTQHSRSFISPGRGRAGKAVRMMNLRALKGRGTSYYLCFKPRQLIFCSFISMCCYLEMMVHLLTKFK